MKRTKFFISGALSIATFILSGILFDCGGAPATATILCIIGIIGSILSLVCGLMY